MIGGHIFKSTGASTIFALATSPGRSAVAVVRISGPDTISALAKLTQGKNDCLAVYVVYEML